MNTDKEVLDNSRIIGRSILTTVSTHPVIKQVKYSQPVVQLQNLPIPRTSDGHIQRKTVYATSRINRRTASPEHGEVGGFEQ
jgi:hypothetical protein